MKKNIYFLVINLAKGGAENQMIKLAIDLKKKDYNVKIISLGKNNDFEAILNENNLNVKRIQLKLGLGLFHLVREIVNFKTDVLISFMFASNIIARFISLFCKLKLITSVRASEISYIYKVLYKISYNRDSYSVFNSQVALDRLKEMKITNSFNSVIINNAISVPNNEGVSNKTNKIFTIVSIAHFREKEKDYKTLFKALKTVKQNGLNFKLYVIGRIFDLTWPIEMIEDFELTENIKLLGFINNPGAYLKKSDALILSTFGESSPNAILEGMAHSLPIIATDVPGCARLLHASKSGFLSKPKDSNDMASILIDLINMPQQEIDKLGDNGFNYVCNNYNEHTVFNQWEKIINK
jgi:glycosyltransferase involved in cell wall biosynthesis